MVTTQVVLKFMQSCVIMEVATEFLFFASVEEFHTDAINVFEVCGVDNINLAEVD